MGMELAMGGNPVTPKEPSADSCGCWKAWFQLTDLSRKLEDLIGSQQCGFLVAGIEPMGLYLGYVPRPFLFLKWSLTGAAAASLP